MIKKVFLSIALLSSLASATPNKTIATDHAEKLEWGIHGGLLPRFGPFLEYRYSDHLGVRAGLLTGIVFSLPTLASGFHIPVTLQFYPKALRGLYMFAGLEGSYSFHNQVSFNGPAISLIGGAGYSFSDKWQVSLSPRYLYQFGRRCAGYGGDLSISYKFGPLF